MKCVSSSLSGENGLQCPSRQHLCTCMAALWGVYVTHLVAWPLPKYCNSERLAYLKGADSLNLSPKCAMSAFVHRFSSRHFRASDQRKHPQGVTVVYRYRTNPIKDGPPFCANTRPPSRRCVFPFLSSPFTFRSFVLKLQTPVEDRN